MWRSLLPILLLLTTVPSLRLTIGAEGALVSAVSPLPGHPGNIFLDGETVAIPFPTNLPPTATHWQLLDADFRSLMEAELPSQPPIQVGKPGVGWYRVEFYAAADAPPRPTLAWTTLAVLAPLRARPPEDSPVAVDSAAAWFARDNAEGQAVFARLAALAGVSWVRDRLRWGDLQPAPGPLSTNRTTYDTSAEAHTAAGLRVLQVFHDTPRWARGDSPAGGHFAPDLRDVYRLCQQLARRFQGTVAAWEPWNEANVPNFGGHTVDQMCSWQKAAWLGFKSVDPTLTVGWNPTAAVPTPQHTRGVMANQTWPYFDTYNIHTYDWAHSYLELWPPARAAAAGRPLWVTEADRGTPHLKNPPWFDQDTRSERLKAEWMAQSYAQSLFAGAQRHFHFILGHYHEPNGVQFGLLRLDLTPRPAYVALAAVGRFLSGARILGRWQPQPDLHVYAFRAFPDAEERDVFVLWNERDVDWSERGRTSSNWVVPTEVRVLGAFDYLGRPLDAVGAAPVTSAPRFILAPAGAASSLPLQPPASAAAAPKAGEASPIVLQALVPRKAIQAVMDLPWSEGHVYRVVRGVPLRAQLAIYNFGPGPVRVEVIPKSVPDGWNLTVERRAFELAPMARELLPIELHVASDRSAADDWVVLEAATAGQPRPTLAMRFLIIDKEKSP